MQRAPRSALSTSRSLPSLLLSAARATPRRTSLSPRRAAPRAGRTSPIDARSEALSTRPGRCARASRRLSAARAPRRARRWTQPARRRRRVAALWRRAQPRRASAQQRSERLTLSCARCGDRAAVAVDRGRRLRWSPGQPQHSRRTRLRRHCPLPRALAPSVFRCRAPRVLRQRGDARRKRRRSAGRRCRQRDQTQEQTRGGARARRGARRAAQSSARAPR